jgi:hypothetical protein
MTLDPYGYHPSWPAAARAQVERAIEAHGGRARFSRVDRIRLGLTGVSGALPRLKGLGRTFPAPAGFEIWPHQRMTVFHGYPDADHRGRFHDGDVSLERIDDGTVTAHSPQHRRSFAGLRKLRRWSPLDALYFFGYALWHYHVMPFSLGDARFVRSVRQGGCDGVEIDFPADVPTHSRRQRCFFGPTGAIIRHDYVADIVGPFARGCHLWLDHEVSDGFLVARHRRVLVRMFGYPTPVSVLDARFSTVEVLDRAEVVTAT